MDPMPDQPHDQAEELLPWYATGQLDAADRALVEKHLASCARCERQLAAERALIHEFQGLTPEVDTGWATLRGRIVTQPRSGPGIGAALAEFWELLKRPAVAALATAQVAFVAIGATVLQWSSQPTYVALGSAPVAASANVIVMFRPEIREAELRGALESSGASLVGGPTEADAYLLHVPANARPAAVEKLQKNANVTLAQPIDGPNQ
jgi:anti-sigma factor RsiW